MKVVILAGGLGTRLSEYTDKIPKPMIKIGEQANTVAYHENLFSLWFRQFYLSFRLQI